MASPIDNTLYFVPPPAPEPEMIIPEPIMSNTPDPISAWSSTPPPGFKRTDVRGIFEPITQNQPAGNQPQTNFGGLFGNLLGLVGSNYFNNQQQSAFNNTIQGYGNLASDLQQQVRFKPFTVTGTTGGASTGYDPQGNLQTQYNLNPQGQAIQQAGLGGAAQFLGQAGGIDPTLAAQRGTLGQLFGAQAQQLGQPTGIEGLTAQSLAGGQQRIGQAMQPTDINLLRGQFAGQVGGLLGQQPSAQLRQLGGQAYAMGQQALAQSPAMGAGATNIGLNLAQQGAGMFGGATVSPFLGSLSQTALGLGTQGLGATPAAARGVDYTGSQLSNLGQQLLSQNVPTSVGALGEQAIAGGMQGLGNITAPSDIEALRSQYSGLAGQAAGGLLTGMGDREQQIFDRIRAAQTPEEQRQRLATEERMAAQGRLGLSSAAYGGSTPELMAQEQAIAEARNRAAISSMEQARAEQGQQLQTAQTLAGLTSQFAGQSSDLQSAAQQRASQLSQLGLSAQQIESQLQSEGLGRGLQATQAGMQAKELSSALTTQAQNRATQLAQLGLSSEQIQSQLQSEGLGRGAQTLQAGLQAQELGSALQSQAQQRAAQLSQLGMSAEQIQSQLQSEGLGRAAQAGGLAADLASTASGLETQALQRGLSLAGLGMQGTELGQGLTNQQLQNLLALQAAGQGTALAQQQLQGGNVDIGRGLLAAGLAPESALLNLIQPSINIASLQGTGQREGANLDAQLRIAQMQAQQNAALSQAQQRQDLMSRGVGLLTGQRQGGNPSILEQIIGGLFGGGGGSSSSGNIDNLGAYFNNLGQGSPSNITIPTGGGSGNIDNLGAYFSALGGKG